MLSMKIYDVLYFQEASFVYNTTTTTDINHDFLFREGITLQVSVGWSHANNFTIYKKKENVFIF